MAEKRPSDGDFESFTIRIPTWLKDSLVRIKGSYSGINTISDAARLALETGAGSFEPLADARELWEMQKDEADALKRIIAKWQCGQQIFNRAELTFIGQLAHRAYMSTQTSNVQGSPIKSNLKAFNAIRTLRNTRYTQTEAVEYRDRYYHGNLGNSGGGTIDDQIASMIQTMKEFPYSSHAEFISRCLEGALRDEPSFPIDQLNDVLRPHLPALIKLALRAYYQDKKKPALAIKSESGFNVASAKYPKPVTHGRICVSPNIFGDNITAAIIWKEANIIVTVNGFIELGELITLTCAASHEHQVYGQRFTIIPPALHDSQYVMRVAGVQITFQDGEFEDLRTALKDVMEQPDMKQEYERLSWIYGDI